MLSNRFVDLRNARKSVTESVTKIDRNDLISVSLVLDGKEIQEQRRLERKVRNTKREADMLNEIGDTEGAKAARVKLKEQRKAYRTYCDKHELTQRSDWLTVSKGSVSAAKTQNPLDNGGGSGIIEETKKNINRYRVWFVR